MTMQGGSGGRSSLMIRNDGGVTVVEFMNVRMLDDTNIKLMEVELKALVDKTLDLRFIVDFTNIQYMSSIVLGKIMELYKQISARKGKLKLCGIDPKIMEVFKIMKLDKVLEIHKDFKSAFNSYTR
ncbi:MAG: STAS domain-containing protein [Planctomycetota bacterium]